MGYVKASPRCYNSIGLFSYCDGNIVGGALLGTGIALAGSCPGTVLAQIGTGVRSGYDVLGGALLGGIVWTGFLKPYFSSCVCANEGMTAPENLTIDKTLAVSKSIAISAMEIIMISAVGSMVALTCPGLETKMPPAVGGLLIGFGQLFSLLTRKTLVGVSAVYEETGNVFWWALSGFNNTKTPTVFSATLFASGLIGGAWALSMAFPHLVDIPSMPIPAPRGVAGGLLMVLGARMAGGCTSGHGISGMSMLSTSSMITMGSAITAGILVAITFLP